MLEHKPLLLLLLIIGLGEAAERFALAAGGRDETRSESREKPEARKTPVSRDESHQSAARFVRRMKGDSMEIKNHA
jgi:phage repressor protein C with HTH and peptisase S24 domain